MADHSEAFTLSHPEILSHERLVDVLSNRGFSKEELAPKDKHALVQLCHLFVVPLPQRASNMRQRRANRLKNKTLHSLKVHKPCSDATESLQNKAGSKRKQPIIDVDRTIKATKLSDYLHDNKHCSPTTDCTQRILKLTVNHQLTTPAKPVKLSRKCLTPNNKMNSNSAATLLHKMSHPKKDLPKVVSPSRNSVEESASSDNSHFDSCEEEIKQDKKFKRHTVTWP